MLNIQWSFLCSSFRLTTYICHKVGRWLKEKQFNFIACSWIQRHSRDMILFFKEFTLKKILTGKRAKSFISNFFFSKIRNKKIVRPFLVHVKKMLVGKQIFISRMAHFCSTWGGMPHQNVSLFIFSYFFLSMLSLSEKWYWLLLILYEFLGVFPEKEKNSFLTLEILHNRCFRYESMRNKIIW